MKKQELQNFPIIRQWSVTKYGLGIQNKFDKNGPYYVQGYIYNHPDHEDGDFFLSEELLHISLEDGFADCVGQRYKIEDVRDGYEL